MGLAAKVNDVHHSEEISSREMVNDVHLPTLLRQAIEDSHVQHKVIARCFGVSDSYLSGMLSGDKPIKGVHLDALPPTVARHLVKRYGGRLGMVVYEPHHEQEVMGRLLAALGEALRTFEVFRDRRQMLKARLR